MNSNLFDYPNKLNKIFDKLANFNIKPIIIGGFIRDSFLNLDSKDIDIEVYGVNSLEILEDILKEFGSVNSVGKSFGVCKLDFEGLDLDFSLPREDSKISSGHRGFEITTHSKLDFKTATSRRDFTINAIGYDVLGKKILDPFNGREDLRNKIIRAVDLSKFAEDPLRVLRAVGFSARFGFTLEEKLLHLCQSLVQNNFIEELPQERILAEFEKFLLKSPKPSTAISLLKKLGLNTFFGEYLTSKELDYYAQHKTLNDRIDLTIFLTLLYDKHDKRNIDKVIKEKILLQTMELMLSNKNSIDLDNYSDYELYMLATKVDIELFLLYINACYLGEKSGVIQKMKTRAKELNILNTKAPMILQGRDLLELGLTPSQEFSKILKAAYDAQLHKLFTDKKEALVWLKRELLF